VAPGTDSTFLYVVDSFMMFQLKQWEAQKAQGSLAFLLMQPEFQEHFNLRKGSIPVNQNVPLTNFDDCAKLSSKDFQAAAKNSSLMPSIAHAMALSTQQQVAMRAVVTEFWQNDKMSVIDAQNKLASLSGAPTPVATKKGASSNSSTLSQ
jgi:glucose/mannose transport system substrate-binding protein